MLGFAPLAALPLVSSFGISSTIQEMSATGAITFGGAGGATAFVTMTASGGLTFSGSPFITARFMAGATGSLTFGGSPNLSVAGRPIIITALYDNFTVRGVPQ